MFPRAATVWAAAAFACSPLDAFFGCAAKLLLIAFTAGGAACVPWRGGGWLKGQLALLAQLAALKVSGEDARALPFEAGKGFSRGEVWTQPARVHAGDGDFSTL